MLKQLKWMKRLREGAARSTGVKLDEVKLTADGRGYEFNDSSSEDEEDGERRDDVGRAVVSGVQGISIR